MDHYYENSHANVHRGVYAIAEEADALYESAQVRVGRFIGAPHPETEVLFSKNATEGLNMVATSWAANNLEPGDADPAHRDGAPRQPGPVADARRAEGHRAADGSTSTTTTGSTSRASTGS